MALKRRSVILIAAGAIVFAGVVVFCASRLDIPHLEQSSSMLHAPIGEVLQLAGHPEKVKELAEFERQLFEAELAAQQKNYPAAHKAFKESLDSAAWCFDKKSFVMYLFTDRVARFESDFSHWNESEKAYKAALAALPEKNSDFECWIAQRDLIVVLREQAKWKECATWSQEHLKLTQSLIAAKELEPVENVRALAWLAYHLDKSGQLEEAEPIWQQYLSAAGTKPDEALNHGYWLLSIVTHAAKMHHNADADKYLTEALKIAQDEHKDDLLADANISKADLLTRRGDLVGAAKALHEALALSKTIKDDSLGSYTYYLLGEIARRRNDLTQREVLQKQALALTGDSGRDTNLAELVVIDALRNQPAEAQQNMSRLFQSDSKEDLSIAEEDIDRLSLAPASTQSKNSSAPRSITLRKGENSFGGDSLVNVSRPMFKNLINDYLRRNSHPKNVDSPH